MLVVAVEVMGAEEVAVEEVVGLVEKFVVLQLEVVVVDVVSVKVVLIFAV